MLQFCSNRTPIRCLLTDILAILWVWRIFMAVLWHVVGDRDDKARGRRCGVSIQRRKDCDAALPRANRRDDQGHPRRHSINVHLCWRIQLEGAVKAHDLHSRDPARSEENTTELQSLMRTSYADFCLKKK